MYSKPLVLNDEIKGFTRICNMLVKIKVLIQKSMSSSPPSSFSSSFLSSSSASSSSRSPPVTLQIAPFLRQEYSSFHIASSAPINRTAPIQPATPFVRFYKTLRAALLPL
jgi:hypothetical protein